LALVAKTAAKEVENAKAALEKAKAALDQGIQRYIAVTTEIQA
jgi:hypothetical protein